MQMNYSELPNDRLSLNRWVKNTLGASPGGNEENRPSMGNLTGQNWRQLIQTNPMAAKQVADMATAARDSGGAPMMNYQNEINRLKQQGISFDAPAPPAEAAPPPVVNEPPNFGEIFGEMFPNQNLGLPNVGDRYGFLDFLKQGGQGGEPFQMSRSDGQPGGGDFNPNAMQGMMQKEKTMADYLSYLKNNPDVSAWAKTSGLGAQEAAGQHYNQFGFYEGRPWPEDVTQSNTSGDLFNIPTLTPESASTTSTATGTSGIDWGSPGASGLLDQIKNWTGRASGMAENVIPNINNFYGNMMRNALQPQAFQGTLNNLRQRNMLDSSVASDALAGTASNIAGQVGNQALSTYLKGFDVQTQMPNMLAQLANVLGGRGTTATGTQTDPMAAYRLAFGYV